jgi:hypothetical protein
MLRLANRELSVELLDPAADAARQGWRYCWGGYIWQIHDAKVGALLAGPEYPKPDPTAFNGQGLPESFRHRRRDTGAALTWSGKDGLAVGAGSLAAIPDLPASDPKSVRVVEPCRWTITPAADQITFQTRHAAAGCSYELTRRIELSGRTLTSCTALTNVGREPLALQWFAHPFWALTNHQACVQFSAGTTVSENPSFAVDAAGLLRFTRPFTAESDSQLSFLTLPSGRELAVSLDHPSLKRVTFATSFVPNECPFWANSHTVSVEPYLNLHLTPGETRDWHVRYGF